MPKVDFSEHIERLKEMDIERNMTRNQQIRSAALIAAAPFFERNLTSTPSDVTDLADYFARYIATGSADE